METEKLTLSDCFKYPKAKVQCYGEKILYDVYFIDVRNEKLWLRNRPFEIGSDRDDISIEDCKLQLRPLSSLTDEENCLCQSLQVIHQNENGEVYYYDSKDSTDYLRSINIDIDGLQEKGVAVYD